MIAPVMTDAIEGGMSEWFESGGRRMVSRWSALRTVVTLFLAIGLAACDTLPDAPTVPAADSFATASAAEYRIGAGDDLSIFVWQDRDLSVQTKVRPDGKIALPLIQEIQAAGTSPNELGKAIQEQLRPYVQDPVVTVIVTNFVGPLSEQIRVVGEAAKPQSLSYRAEMTVLDALVAAGGLTQFADGNKAVLVRRNGEASERYRLRLADLLERGDVSANVALVPGDVLIIPQTYF